MLIICITQSLITVVLPDRVVRLLCSLLLLESFVMYSYAFLFAYAHYYISLTLRTYARLTFCLCTFFYCLLFVVVEFIFTLNLPIIAFSFLYFDLIYAYCLIYNKCLEILVGTFCVNILVNHCIQLYIIHNKCLNYTSIFYTNVYYIHIYIIMLSALLFSIIFNLT